MSIAYPLKSFIENAALASAASLPEFGPEFQPLVQLADPHFGDFQLNGVLSYAKAWGQNPRILAQSLVNKLKEKLPGHLFGIEIAGPGFINIQLSAEALFSWLSHFRSLKDLQDAASEVLKNEIVVIDYSSPNTAKQMHVGHLRSLVIGEAIQRILRFHGAKVIRDNHLGDWGTQFGILLMQIKKEGYQLDAPHADSLEDLEGLYKRGSACFKENQIAQEEARRELLLLQQGDPKNQKLWEAITRVSLKAFQAIYDAFGVEFDQIQGESFYRTQLERVYTELNSLGLAESSEGALVVFHPEHPRFKTLPFIIKKTDGASNYATTDLATALHHVETKGATRLLYVVDARQQDHFQQLFLTLNKWFSKKHYPLPKMEHISFGTVLDEHGKAIKTRFGEPIRLKDLIEEAKARAFSIVQSKAGHLTKTEQENIAQVVGMGALRYADLSQNRASDYIFSWDKMLALEGNTAPYLLYALARIHSIFNKLKLKAGDAEAGASIFETAQEKALARKLVLFPAALEATLQDLRPHYLCNYLYELAGLFSSFYSADKVIDAQADVQARRLMLCARTLLILETGLHLLGIETLEKM